MLNMESLNGSVQLLWHTPQIDAMIADIARVSNVKNVGKDPAPLIAYMLRNKHWSPFEMANVCVMVKTTRDVGRHILRHDLKPQEFSQRYASLVGVTPVVRECRMQDPANRQNSTVCEDFELAGWWLMTQLNVWDTAAAAYNQAIERGIAREVARVVLPEGMTPTLMIFNGNLRNWLHFCGLRMGNGTQKECAEIATKVYNTLRQIAPLSVQAFDDWLETQ